MTEGEPLVLVENLGKRFGSTWIFRKLTFQVTAGQSLLVLGRNGAGKTTLLKTLGGLATPEEGRVQLQTPDLRLGLGFSGLDQSVYPHLTVAEHLELFAKLRGIPPRTAELLDKINLAAAANRWASRLSTGMRNRLKLALAIQPNPAILILDEPAAAMDEHGRELVAEICREQTQRGALIIATNDPADRHLGTHELELQ